MSAPELSLTKQALLRIEQLERENALLRAAEPIAILGLACRFPGGAGTPEQLWDLLRTGRDAVSEVPAERWPVDRFYDPDPDAPGRSYSRHGGFLDQAVDLFDPAFFGVSPLEARALDPQQRLLLEVSWEALENAGLPIERLRGSRTGVFVGIAGSDYLQAQLLAGGAERIGPYHATGAIGSTAVGRIAYTFDFRGPAVAVDTACSSSLVALDQACASLRLGTSELALAGGVSLILGPEGSICFARMKALSASGRCRTFDAAADGFVRAEGCGLAVLKRLADARRDGDPVLAVIRGSAVNQDGRSNGLTAPSLLAQRDVIRRALAQAAVEPLAVSYVEAHGTGTPLGDPIEVEALAGVLCPGRQAPLLVGSIKTNLGHLEAAAGIAGLFKIVLALRHGAIPPHLHLVHPSPHIPWADLPLRVPTHLTPWAPGDTPRVAGLSSFGFGGTNAHLVIAEAPPAPAAPQTTIPTTAAPSAAPPSAHLLCLSAKTPAALTGLAAAYDRCLTESAPPEALDDLCAAALAGRSHFRHRLAVVGESAAELRQGLTQAAGDSRPEARGGETVGRRGAPPVVFLFGGQGAQYAGMGRELYLTEPRFRAVLDHCSALLAPRLGCSIAELLDPRHPEAALLGLASHLQPALFAVEYALASLWRAWGVEPAAVAGHSIGELVAACVAGVFSLEDALALIAERGRLVQSLALRGTMATVFAGEEQVDAELRRLGHASGHESGDAGDARAPGADARARGGFDGSPPAGHLGTSHPNADPGASASGGHLRGSAKSGPDETHRLGGGSDGGGDPNGKNGAVVIAAVNGAAQVVIAGGEAAVAAALAHFAACGLRTRPLAATHAFHSSFMDPILPAMEQAAAAVRFHAPTLPIASGLTGQGGADLGNSRYWAAQLRRPVRFGSALDWLLGQGYRIFLEISPAATLTALGRLTGQSSQTGPSGQTTPSAIWLPSLRRGQPERRQILTSAAELYRLKVDLDGMAPARPLPFPVLPNHPFERQRYWFDGADAAQPSVEARPPASSCAVPAGAPWRETMSGSPENPEITGAVGAPGPVSAPTVPETHATLGAAALLASQGAPAMPGLPGTVSSPSFGDTSGGPSSPEIPGAVGPPGAPGPLGALGSPGAAPTEPALTSGATAPAGVAEPAASLERRGLILASLKRVVADSSGLAEAGVDIHTNLLEMGLDSLMLMQVRQEIGRGYGVEIPVSEFFQGLETLAKLAAYLDSRSPATPAASIHGAPATAPALTLPPTPATPATSTVPLHAANPPVSLVPPQAWTAAPAAAPPPAAALPSPLAAFQAPAQEPPAGASSASLVRLMEQQLQAMSQLVAQQLAALHPAGGAGGTASSPPPALTAQSALPAGVSPRQLPAQPAFPPEGAALSALAASGTNVAGVPSGAAGPSGATLERGTNGTAVASAPNGSDGPTLANEAVPAVPASGAAPETFVPYRRINTAPETLGDGRRRAHVEGLVARYGAATQASKERTAAFRPVFANNRNIAGFRPAWKEMVYQIIAERAQGSRIWAVGGREYIDLTMGFGVHLFGHRPPFLAAAIEHEIRQGMPLGPMSHLAGQAAQEICAMTGAERVAFYNTGSEAIMVALRIARTVTARSKVVLFEGSYHGGFDGVLAAPRWRDGVLSTVPGSPGTTQGMVDDVLVLKYGAPESLERIRNCGAELAAVLVEPVQSRRPDLRPREFLHELRRITAASGAALIFDEMVLGFRLEPGGAQAYFDVRADLATYGKVIGGGMPIGIVAGRADFMDAVDGGMWSFGDDSYPRKRNTFVAGTFCHHPLSMAAALAVLAHLRAAGPALQQNLNRTTARFCQRLNDFFTAEQAPIRVEPCGSLFRFFLRGDAELLFYHLIEKGIYIWEGRNCFLSTAHTEEDLDRVYQAVVESIAEMRRGGFLGEAPPERAAATLPAAAALSAPAAHDTPAASAAAGDGGRRPMELSLFYFSSADEAGTEKYRLLLEGARYADRHGFTAVWTPERHFHAFGGLYPNPSITSAALATITERIRIRAGSTVLLLHDPVRFAENWSMVDNLSGGRVDLAIALGWNSNDFFFAPAAFERRSDLLPESLETVRRLWRGETLTGKGGKGEEVRVQLHPRPVQSDLALWFPASGNPQTFAAAGAQGVNVLTYLEGQTIEELAARIALYRDTRRAHGHEPRGHVTLMLHTLVGDDDEVVREQARPFLKSYLASSFFQRSQLVSSLGKDLTGIQTQDLDPLLDRAVDRYLSDRALIGTPDSCLALIERLRAIGVDEVGCLIDFGVDFATAMAGLVRLNEVRARCQPSQPSEAVQQPQPVQTAQIVQQQQLAAVAQPVQQHQPVQPSETVQPPCLTDFPHPPQLPHPIQLPRPAQSPLPAQPSHQAHPPLPARLPLSSGQRELWALVQASPEASLAYHESVLLRLIGPLDPPAFTTAVERLIERHQALRLTELDGAAQTVLACPPAPILWTDLTAGAALETTDSAAATAPQGVAGQQTEAGTPAAVREGWLAREARRPFDLEKGLLFRLRLARTAGDEHLVLLTFHHLITNGWSIGILLEELATLYSAARQGLAAVLPEATPWSAYLEWDGQRAVRSAPHESYWRRQLAAPWPPLALPADHPLPARPRHAGGRRQLRIEGATHLALRALAARQGVTLFICLLTAWKALLLRLSGQERVTVGVALAEQAAMGTPRLVGHCTSLLPACTDAAGAATFAELLQRVRRTVLEIYDHQEVSLATLAAAEPPLPLPAIDTLFNMDRAPALPAFAGLAATLLPAPVCCVKFDLGLNVLEIEGGLLLDLDWKSGLFETATAERWLDLLGGALRAVAADPAVPLGSLFLSPEEAPRRGQHAAGGPGGSPNVGPNVGPDSSPDTASDIGSDSGPDGLLAAWSRQVELQPAAPALEAAGEIFTFEALDRQAKQTAEHLRHSDPRPGGPRPEDRVNLCGDPRALLTTLLACLDLGVPWLWSPPDGSDADGGDGGDGGERFFDSRRDGLAAGRERLAPTGVSGANGTAAAATGENIAGDGSAAVFQEIAPASVLFSSSPPVTATHAIAGYFRRRPERQASAAAAGSGEALAMSRRGLARQVEALRKHLLLGPGDCLAELGPLSLDLMLAAVTAGARFRHGVSAAETTPGAAATENRLAGETSEPAAAPLAIDGAGAVGAAGPTAAGARSAASVVSLPVERWSEVERLLGAAESGAASHRLRHVLIAGGPLLYGNLEIQPAGTVTLHHFHRPAGLPLVGAIQAIPPGLGTTTSADHSLRPVPVGRPLRRSALLDSRRQTVPEGAVGEWWIASDESAAVPAPAGAAGDSQPGGEPPAARQPLPPPLRRARPQDGLFPTGELARRIAGGAFVVLGPAAERVTIDGRAVDPRQVAAVLRTLTPEATVAGVPTAATAATVATVASIASETPAGATASLRAAVALPAGGSIEALRRHLAELVPPWQVPAEFVRVHAPAHADAIAGAAGQRGVDAAEALPAPTSPNARSAPDTHHEPPAQDEPQPHPMPQVHPAPDAHAPQAGETAASTPTEKCLVRAWETVLGRPALGIHDDFYQLGGNSLKATRLAIHLERELGIEIGLRDLLEGPTIHRLARRLDRRKSGGRAPIPRLPGAGPYPLSHAQERLWMLQQRERGSAAYNVAAGAWLHGPLDRAALDRALAAVVARHESLRTRVIDVEGEPRQEIGPAEAAGRLLDEVDLTAAESPELLVQAIARDEARRPFDLARGPLLRGQLLRLAAERHAVLLNLHHIVCDGWSLELLMRDAAHFYRHFSTGAPADLPPLPIQYRDYAAWQRTAAAADPGARGFWRRSLAGELPVVSLPADFPRPAVQTSNGSTLRLTFDPALTDDLRRLGAERRASLFSVLLSAVKVLLLQITGERDLVVGAPFAGRAHPALAEQIGLYVNTLPLRDRLRQDEPFTDLLERVQRNATESFENAEVPLDLILADLEIKRDWSRSPLFDVLLMLESERHPETAWGALTVTPFAVDSAVSLFDLSFHFTETAAGLDLELLWNRDLFRPERMRALADRLLHVLRDVAAHPGSPVAALGDLTPGQGGRERSRRGIQLVSGFNL